MPRSRKLSDYTGKSNVSQEARDALNLTVAHLLEDLSAKRKKQTRKYCQRGMTLWQWDMECLELCRVRESYRKTYPDAAFLFEPGDWIWRRHIYLLHYPQFISKEASEFPEDAMQVVKSLIASDK